MKYLVFPTALIGAITLIACGADAPSTTTGVRVEPVTPVQQTPPPKPSMEQETKKSSEEVAVLETNYGKIVIRLFSDRAPKHVESFKSLAKKGFYEGTTFHRVIPGFMIQGGDPLSKNSNRADDGTGGPGYTVKAEFNSTPFVRGVLGAARSGDPDSAGSQFFIMVAPAPHLNGQYTAFGEVLEGMDVADKIVTLPKDARDNPLEDKKAVIKSVKLEERKA